MSIFLSARNFLILACLAVSAALASGEAHARQSYSGIVLDAKTGKTLYGHRADARAYPASLTKMMTLYMVFEALERGELKQSSRIRFSRRASSMPASKLGVRAGKSISVKEAISALIIKSANDVAVAVAERLAGSESKFAAGMTKRARQLGMKHTRFRNASGLPNPKQVTTARDMAKLGIALREHFPQYYDSFSKRRFSYAGRRISTHNKLVGAVRGVDGIKTGYTRASGYNLVSSVERSGRSIVAVVMGGRTSKSRNAQMRKIISNHLSKASKGRDRQVIARVSVPPVHPGIARVVPVSSNVVRIALAESTQSVPLSVAASAPAPTPPTPASPVGFSSGERLESDSSVLLAFASEPASGSPSETIPSPFATGFMIQIGAGPNREAAFETLRKALRKAPELLGDVQGRIDAVPGSRSGTEIHRIRFVGFETLKQARKACVQLKRKRFPCLALSG